MNDSITKAINDWLLTLDMIKDNYDIAIEELPDGTKELALQRTGVVTVKSYYGGLHKQNQYQYMLFLSENSEGDSKKVKNFDWLDDLCDEIRVKNSKNELPKMVGKIFNNAECMNPITFEVTEDGYITHYAVQLYFKINE